MLGIHDTVMGFHVRRNLISVFGLDHPFVGFAAINIHPQHL